MVSQFSQSCIQQSSCEIVWQIPPRSSYRDLCGGSTSQTTTNNFADYALFVEFECDISEVKLEYFGTISRNTLLNIVVVCEGLICLAFAINICCLSRSFESEQHQADTKFVHMTDFAVRIKNLPPESAYDNLEHLKAKLLIHLSEVVKREP